MTHVDDCFFSEQFSVALYGHKFKLGRTYIQSYGRPYSDTVKCPTKARICENKLGDEDAYTCVVSLYS